ncbi:MAG: IS66 family transposase [Candidatus Auribacterota bacterium]|nr:IS66 family transposase [Candidatus Auribacterota bacterium]
MSILYLKSFERRYAMTPEEALAIYHAGPETVVKVLLAFSAELVSLRERVKALEDQIAKNSRNSSKPPSSDGFNKPAPRSLRKRGERKPGGQPGHPGQTLKQVEKPDHIIIHPVKQCQHCGRSIADEPASDCKKRQVFDIPPLPKIEVTEHQAEIKECPHCNHINKAEFPEDVKAPVQYGSRLKAMAVYLMDYQLLPYQRTREFFNDIFSQEISEGTLVNISNACFDLLDKPVEQIRQQLITSPVVNFDETSTSLNGKRHWLHVAATKLLTFYQIHKKRGTEAMDAIGILPYFEGRAIHDFMKSYLTYDCRHGFCNAHLLRELIFLHEQQQQYWAGKMHDCLVEINKAVDRAPPDAICLSDTQAQEFEELYSKFIDEGYVGNPMPEKKLTTRKKRGRPKKPKAINLLNRFRDYEREILAFMYDFRVPFDNNLAERDLRMMKTQQKISGTFRSTNGADAFCRIRSYISTIRKNSENVIESIYNAFNGRPFIPVTCSKC